MSPPIDARSRLEASVRGMVQGVGFRLFVARRAADLGLEGWVANEPDGSVRVVAEGPELDLRALEAALREGPPGAWVRDVQASLGPATGREGAFAVRAGSHPGD